MPEATTDDEEIVDDEEQDEETKPAVEESGIDLDAVDEALDEEQDKDTDDESDTDVAQPDAEDGVDLDGETFGDAYVKGLCTVSNGVIQHYGDEDDPAGVDERMARDLELDKAMNEWIRSKGVTEEMPPGQALLVATVMFLFAALASNPAVVNGLLDELGDDTQ